MANPEFRGQPSPFFATLDKVYSGAVNAVFLSYSALRASIFVYRDNLRFSQYSLFVGLARFYTITVAAFCNAVSLVVALCAHKKMIWVNARWIVAAMAALHFGMNWAFEMLGKQAARNAMSCPTRHHAVTVTVAGALPNPTAANIINDEPSEWVNSLFCHTPSYSPLWVTHQGVR